MKIALITDAWSPQVNGVVRTLVNLVESLGALGHEVLVLHPGLFRNIPYPNYPSIRLALFPYRKVVEDLEAFKPQAIHLPTEGPLGLAGKKYCRSRKLPYTSSFHTHFGKYLKMYYRLPESISLSFLRWFHKPAVRTLVPTPSVRDELIAAGFKHLVVWGRGVNTQLFHPQADGSIDLERPIYLNVGRVAREKNIEAFTALDLPGSKVVIGEGPRLNKLRHRYRDTLFTGYISDETMATYYAAADVFVFPSHTDTFGNVMLEALASGTPVAAYDGAPGPMDVLKPEFGVLGEDMAETIRRARELDPAACRAYAETLPWSMLAEQFEGHLEPF